MGYGLLIAGLALWWAAHLLKRVAPQLRDAMGKHGRSLIAIVIVVGLVLMIWGYRVADTIPLYDLAPIMRHITNLLSVVAIYLLGVAPTRSMLVGKVRHPMLLGVIVWSLGHLLTNGHLAAVLLFGGMGLWALITIVVINSAEGAWQRPESGIWKGDLINVAGTTVIVVIIVGVHTLLGVNPLTG